VRSKALSYDFTLEIMVVAQGQRFHDLPVSLAKPEDGWIVARGLARPGCVSQGRDEKEALGNIKEAITGWLRAEDQKAVKAKNSDATPVVVAV
jgi:predicted RNase H-like HicB family nuclease